MNMPNIKLSKALTLLKLQYFMGMERFSITNRHGLKLVVQVDTPEEPRDLVFIEPGQGGFIEQEHIAAFAQAFLENDFRVVRFDPTNSSGQSGGDILNVTYDNYYEDLEDVIEWAQTQSWFKQPFALSGHSMGAQMVAFYAEQHPDKVSYLAPIGAVVNYQLLMPTYDTDYLEKWKERGYVEIPSRSKPGLVKRVGWGVNESLKKFDLLPAVAKLTMPAIFIVGEFDRPCPYKNQRVLFDRIPSPNKELVKIDGAEHSFRNYKTGKYDEKLEAVRSVLSNWLRSVHG